ncbi:MAG TPA: hypothetical protein PK022_03140, partial [Syntrophales bacterium]|nr:hypothetical protein [Syntrophales bacterium]
LPGQFPVKLLEYGARKHVGQKSSFRRRFRVDLEGNPFDLKGDFPANNVDNSLADIAEWSYVIVINLDLYCHGILPE